MERGRPCSLRSCGPRLTARRIGATVRKASVPSARIDRVVLSDRIGPGRIADFGQMICALDEIGQHHGRELEDQHVGGTLTEDLERDVAERGPGISRSG